MTGGSFTSLPLRLPVAGAAGSVLSLDQVELHWARDNNSYVSVDAGQRGYELLYDTQMMYNTDEYAHSASRCVDPALLHIPEDQLKQIYLDRTTAPMPSQMAELAPPGSLPLSSLDLSDPVLIAAIHDYCAAQDKLNAPVVKTPALTQGPAGIVPPANLAVPMTQKAIPDSPQQHTSDVIDTFYHFDAPPVSYQPAPALSVASSSQPPLGHAVGPGAPACPVTYSYGLVPPTPVNVARRQGSPSSTLAPRSKGQATAAKGGAARARSAVAGVPHAPPTHPCGSQRGHPYPRPSTSSAHVTTGHANSGSHVYVGPQSVPSAYSPPEAYSPPSSSGSSGTRARSDSRSISPPSAAARNPHAPFNAPSYVNAQVSRPPPVNRVAAQHVHAQQPSQPLAPLVPSTPVFKIPSKDVARRAYKLVDLFKAETDIATKSLTLHWRTINVRMLRSRQSTFRNLGQWYDATKDDDERVALILAINMFGWVVDRYLILGA